MESLRGFLKVFDPSIPFGECLLGWFSALTFVCGAIWYFSKDLDSTWDPRDVRAYSERLRYRLENPNSWLPNFIKLFDRIFGDDHYAPRCVNISVTISIISFMLSYLLISSSSPSFLGLAKNLKPMESGHDFFTYITISYSLAVLANVTVDYVSLLETRIVLNLNIPIWAKLLLDFALTFIIVIAWILIIIWLFMSLPDGTPQEHKQIAITRFLIELCRIDMTNPAVLLTYSIIATSYMTSLWLWLHGLAHLTTRLIATTSWLSQKVRVDTQPFRATGFVLMVYVFIVGTLAFMVLMHRR